MPPKGGSERSELTPCKINGDREWKEKEREKGANIVRHTADVLLGNKYL